MLAGQEFQGFCFRKKVRKGVSCAVCALRIELGTAASVVSKRDTAGGTKLLQEKVNQEMTSEVSARAVMSRQELGCGVRKHWARRSERVPPVFQYSSLH